MTKEERARLAPKCKRDGCEKRVKWNTTTFEYGVFCSRECHNMWRRGKPSKEVKHKDKQFDILFSRPKIDPPICAAKGCTNPVKWSASSWAIYCGTNCMLRSKKLSIESEKTVKHKAMRDLETECEYNNWDTEVKGVVDRVLGDLN